MSAKTDAKMNRRTGGVYQDAPNYVDKDCAAGLEIQQPLPE